MGVRALYPGSFDPCTNGHLNIASRAAAMFSELVVAVYAVPQKNLMFSTEERAQLFSESLEAAGVRNVRVVPYEGLTVAAAVANGASVIVRGIRAFDDFLYESDMSVMNRKMAPGVESIILMTHLEYSYISSSRVKELARIGVSIADLVPEPVAAALQARFPDSEGGNSWTSST